VTLVTVLLTKCGLPAHAAVAVNMRTVKTASVKTAILDDLRISLSFPLGSSEPRLGSFGSVR
jgi:hypothetical protein